MGGGQFDPNGRSPAQLAQQHGRARGFMSPVPVERRQHPNPWVAWRIEHGVYTGHPRSGHRTARDDPDKVCGIPLPNGGTCRNWKGFRTGHPGKGACFKHRGGGAIHERKWMVMSATELALQNGDTPPTSPEEAAQYLLEMTQFYVRSAHEAISAGKDLSAAERTFNLRLLQEFSARQTVLVLGLLKLGYRGELVGKDARRAVVLAVDLALDKMTADDAFRAGFLEALADALDDLEAEARENGRKVLGEASAKAVKGGVGSHSVIEGRVRSTGGAEDGAGLPYESWSVRELVRELSQRGLDFVPGSKARKASVLRADDAKGYAAS